MLLKQTDSSFWVNSRRKDRCRKIWRMMRCGRPFMAFVTLMRKNIWIWMTKSSWWKAMHVLWSVWQRVLPIEISRWRVWKICGRMARFIRQRLRISGRSGRTLRIWHSRPTICGSSWRLLKRTRIVCTAVLLRQSMWLRKNTVPIKRWR